MKDKDTMPVINEPKVNVYVPSKKSPSPTSLLIDPAMASTSSNTPAVGGTKGSPPAALMLLSLILSMIILRPRRTPCKGEESVNVPLVRQIH